MNASARASAFGRRLRVGDRELDDRLPEHAAQAGLARRLRDLLLEVVHVGEGRRARLDHLERGQPRAGAHELRRHGLGFGREDVLLQPVHQRQVVGEPAIHHHRRVRVGVDQPGQDDLVARVDRLGRADTSRRSPSGVPTSTMSVPSMATAPGDRISCGGVLR